MTNPMQQYHFADIATHSALLKSQDTALEAEHQAILADVYAAADFWGGTGSTAVTEFVTELGRQFAIIYDTLGTHGDKVATASMHTSDTDHSVSGIWA